MRNKTRVLFSPVLATAGTLAATALAQQQPGARPAPPFEVATSSKLVCAFGAPGFNGSNPDLLLTILGVEADLTATKGLATSGRFFAVADKPLPFALTPQTTPMGALFKFKAVSQATPDRPEPLDVVVTVLDAPFKRQLAGVSADEAKSLKAAVAFFSDQPGTPIDGGCAVE